MKIVYFGSSGSLSTLPLIKLLNGDHTLCAVVVDGQYKRPDARIPVVNEQTSSVANIATLSQIPVIYLDSSLNSYTAALSAYKPDVIIVSCFCHKIPEQILALARLGSFNLHPSLLPAFRGPTPLFWQFRMATKNYGITLHRISNEWDAGNIIAQISVPMPDQITFQRACYILANAGSELLDQSLRKLESSQLLETPQLKKLASYQGLPMTSDFVISNQWSASRIVNFICATRNWHKLYPYQIDNHIYLLKEVLEFNPVTSAELVITDQQITFPCHPGAITAKYVKNPS